jgi:hypothetical protein
MSPKLAPLLAALALCAFAQSAAAQSKRSTGHADHDRYAHRDDHRDHGHDRLADRDDGRDHDRRHHEHRPPRRPTQPARPPRPAPPPRADFRFDGRFESLPIAFVATSPDGIYESCRAQSTAFSSEWVDDIEIFGQRVHKDSGYFSVDALCAVAALNARPLDRRSSARNVAGQVESVPFRVLADRSSANDLLRRYLPVALENAWVDDVTVDGQLHRNPSGWWTMEQIVQIILSRT